MTSVSSARWENHGWGLKQICHTEYQGIPSPCWHDILSPDSSESLALCYIDFNVHKFKVNCLPEYSCVNPVELTTPNCFIPLEYVLVLSIGSWTSGSEKVSFLLPHNHPIWVLLLCHSGWFQVDDHLKKEATCFFGVKVSAVLDVTACAALVETT